VNAILRKRMEEMRPWREKSAFRALRWGFEVEVLVGRLEMKIVLSASVELAETVSCWRWEGSSISSSCWVSAGESSVGSMTGGAGWSSGWSSLESLEESLLR